MTLESERQWFRYFLASLEIAEIDDEFDAQMCLNATDAALRMWENGRRVFYWEEYYRE